VKDGGAGAASTSKRITATRIARGLAAGARGTDRIIRVTCCGRICLGNRKINLSVAVAEQLVGIRDVDDQVWRVSVLEYDLGYFDQDQDRAEPGPNPFAPDTLSTMCPERGVDHVIGIHPPSAGSFARPSLAGRCRSIQRRRTIGTLSSLYNS
jgi:hypothetical protein